MEANGRPPRPTWPATSRFSGLIAPSLRIEVRVRRTVSERSSRQGTALEASPRHVTLPKPRSSSRRAGATREVDVNIIVRTRLALLLRSSRGTLDRSGQRDVHDAPSRLPPRRRSGTRFVEASSPAPISIRYEGEERAATELLPGGQCLSGRANKALGVTLCEPASARKSSTAWKISSLRVHHERAVLRDRLVRAACPRSAARASALPAPQHDAVADRALVARIAMRCAGTRGARRSAAHRDTRRRTRCASPAAPARSVAPAGSCEIEIQRLGHLALHRRLSTPWLAPAITRTVTPSGVANSGSRRSGCRGTTARASCPSPAG